MMRPNARPTDLRGFVYYNMCTMMHGSQNHVHDVVRQLMLVSYGPYITCWTSVICTDGLSVVKHNDLS